MKLNPREKMSIYFSLVRNWIGRNRDLFYKILTLCLWVFGWLFVTGAAYSIAGKFSSDCAWIWYLSIGIMLIVFGGLKPLSIIAMLGIGVARPEHWFSEVGKGGADGDE